MVKNTIRKMEMPEIDKLLNNKKKRGAQQPRREATVTTATTTTTTTTTQSTKRINKHTNDIVDAVHHKTRYDCATPQDDIDDDYFEDEDDEEAEGSETDLLDDDDDDDVDDEATLLISSDEEEFLETQRISLPELIVKKLLHTTTTTTTTTDTNTPTTVAMNVESVEIEGIAQNDAKTKEIGIELKEAEKQKDLDEIDKTNEQSEKTENVDEKQDLEKAFPKPMLEPKLEELDGNQPIVTSLETAAAAEETEDSTSAKRCRARSKPKAKLSESNVHVDEINDKTTSKRNVISATSSNDKRTAPVLGHINFYTIKQILSYQCALCKKSSFNEFNSYTQHLRTNHQIVRCLEQSAEIMVVIPTQRKSTQQLEKKVTNSAPMPSNESSNMDLKSPEKDIDNADQPKDDKENILSEVNKRNAELERDSYYACGFVALQDPGSLSLVCKHCDSVQKQEEHFKKHLLLEHQTLLPATSNFDDEKGKQSPSKDENFKRNCLLPTIQESNLLATPAPDTPPPEKEDKDKEKNEKKEDKEVEKSLNNTSVIVEEISSIENGSVLHQTTSSDQANDSTQHVNVQNVDEEQIQETRTRRPKRQRVSGSTKAAAALSESDVERKSKRVRTARSSQESGKKTKTRKIINESSNLSNDVQVQQKLKTIETVAPESTSILPSTQMQRGRRRIKCASQLTEPKQEKIDASSTQLQKEQEHKIQDSAAVAAQLLPTSASNETVRTVRKRGRSATITRKQIVCDETLDGEENTEKRNDSKRAKVSDEEIVELTDNTIDCNQSESSGNNRSQQKNPPQQQKQQQQQQQQQKSKNPSGFVCEICKKSYKKLSRFIEHRRLHTGEQPFACDKCDKRFRIKARLTVHKMRHLGIKSFQCNVCSLALTTKQDLAQHKRYHTGIRPHACTYCAKAFVRSSDLKIHLRVHTGEKPFACDICNQSFRANQNLYVHKKTHLGVKDVVCEFCQKRFMRKMDLRIHMRVHTGEKPFKCEICGRGFSSKFNVRTHIERFHVENANGNVRKKPGRRSNALRAELERQKDLIDDLRNQLAQHIKTEEETTTIQHQHQPSQQQQQQQPQPLLILPATTALITTVIPSAAALSGISAATTTTTKTTTTTTKSLQIITSDVLLLEQNDQTIESIADQQHQSNFELPMPTYGMPNAVHTGSLPSSGLSSSSSSTHSPQLDAQNTITTTSHLKNEGATLHPNETPQAHDISILAVFTAQPHAAVHLNDLAADSIAATTTPLRLQLPNTDSASRTQKKERKVTSYFNVMGQ